MQFWASETWKELPATNRIRTAQGCRHKEFLNTSVAQIVDEYVPLTIKTETPWIRQLIGCRAVGACASHNTAKTFRSRSNNAMIVVIQNVKICSSIEHDSNRAVECCRSTRSTTCQCDSIALSQSKELNSIVATVCDIQTRCKVGTDTTGAVQHG